MALPPVAWPTLGWQVIDWIETYMCHGPGDIQGEPWTPDIPGAAIDDEEALFICWLYRLWPQGHKQAGRRLVRRAIYSRPKGRRKALALDTPIATPDGWTTMGAIETGAVVFDEHGEPTRVIDTSEVFTGNRCYEVEFSDGEVITADAGHLWTIEELRKEYRSVTLTTEQISSAVTTRSDGARNFRLTMPGPLALPDLLLPIDPYVFGAWLGDGNTYDARITAAEQEILDEIHAAGYSTHHRESFGKYGYWISGLNSQLRQLGVLRHKHIPPLYLRASFAQRLALLQGLMDTDGWCAKRDGHCNITTTKPALRDGIGELLATLGIKSKVREYRTKLRGKDCGPAWTFGFYAYQDMPMFRLPRKQKRVRVRGCTGRAHLSDTRRIVAVREVDSVPTRCIAVDSPTHLFLAGRKMVQTHNSEIAGALMCAEALGPVRCDGFDASGEPVGVPVTYPFIRCLATEEEQAGNTYDNVVYMLSEGEAANEYRFDIGRSVESSSRVFIAGGGEIRPSTSGDASKDGGKESAAVADEPLALDTPIPTPDGWTTMGEIETGSYVLGSDGHPVLVWGVSPIKHDRACFRVTFEDGTSVVSDASHRWKVRDRHHVADWCERTTEQMASANWYGKLRFNVPRANPLELPPADLPLDPWVLGMWLGDGDSRASKLAVGDEDLAEVLAELERRGFTTSIYRSHIAIVNFNHGMRYGKSGTSRHALRELNLLQNKHVPTQYLRASRQQRLDLLAGLMDSDGYANERGNCTFTNVNRRLCDAVVELARSFGWRAAVGSWQSDERWKIRVTGTWRVSFTPTGDIPFRLPRKASRCRTARQRTRAIVAIEPVPTRPVRCIAVDSDDHLFLAGEGMVPTHNSHLYTSRQLRAMYQTVARNTGKRMLAEPLMLDTTTAWQPGERSIAEQAADRYAHLAPEECAVKHGVLYDHRQGDVPKRFGDDRSLIKAMRVGYGPAADWMDFGRIVKIIRDAEDPEADAYRYFLNRPRAASSHWLAPTEITQVLQTLDVPAGSRVTGGFDGSENNDHTALMGCTKQGDLFTVGIWTPDGDELGWRDEVNAAVDWLFSTFEVVRFYGDPPWWQEEMGRWAAKHGSPPVIEFWTNVDSKMAVASGALRTAIRQRGIRIDPNPRLTAEQHREGKTLLAWHFENARTRKVKLKFEDRAEEAHVVRKDRPGSPLKIDTVTSSVLARRARDDALKAGEFETPEYSRWTDGSDARPQPVNRRSYVPCVGCGKPIHPKLHEPSAPERGLCVRCRARR